MEQAKTIKPGRIQYYRQPIVTATGIILGFILDYSTRWLNAAFREDPIHDLIISITLVVSITSLLTVLYRILRMDYPRENEHAYYSKTLRLFIIGIGFPFVSILFFLIERIATRPLPVKIE